MHRLLPLQVAAQHKHRAGVTVIGTTGAVLPHRAAKLGHGQNHHIIHAITEVGDKCRDGLREIRQTLRELTVRAALIDVSIPSTYIRKRHFETDV